MKSIPYLAALKNNRPRKPRKTVTANHKIRALFKSRQRNLGVVILEELFHFRAGHRLGKLLDRLGIHIIFTGHQRNGEIGVVAFGYESIFLRVSPSGFAYAGVMATISTSSTVRASMSRSTSVNLYLCGFSTISACVAECRHLPSA